MYKILIVFLLYNVSPTVAKAQDSVKMYAFINQLYSPPSPKIFRPGIFKSDWGNFLLPQVYPIHSAVVEKINTALSLQTAADSLPVSIHPPGTEFTNTPKEVLAELYENCKNLDSAWQENFLWQQDKIYKYLLVKNTRQQPAVSAINKLQLTAKEKPAVIRKIREWNKASIESRLVNYCSIPVFTNDGRYALIIIGQDCRSEGGWDSIFIFKKINGVWEKQDELAIATI